MIKTSSTTISWMRLNIIWTFICNSNKLRRIYRSSFSRIMRQSVHIITEFIHSDRKSRLSKKTELINFLWSCYSDSLAHFLSRTTSAFEIYWMMWELLKINVKICFIIIFISTKINKLWFLSLLTSFSYLLKQLI